MTTQRSTEDVMRGIVDLGILAYARRPPGRLVSGRLDPRNTSPPSAALQLRWSSGDLPAPRAEARKGKGDDGYLYLYYGRENPAQKSPFQVFADTDLKLSITWVPPDIEHRIAYAKRTARPLLEVQEPTNPRDFSRHQILNVRLSLAETPYFQADQFRLTMSVTPQDSSENNGRDSEGLQQQLEVESDGRGFRGSLRLDRLPRGRGPKDYYTLGLLAEGMAGPENALASYRLELPPRTIAVDNTVVLEPVPRIELTRAEPSRRVTIRTLAAYQGALELRPGLTLPRSDRGPIGTETLTVRQVDPPIEAGTIRLQDGEATIEITLAADSIPTGGVVYQDGKIVLSAIAEGEGLAPLEIPVGLRIDLIQLASDPPEYRLEARTGGDRSAPIRILAPELGDPPKGLDRVRVALAAEGDGVRFSKEELWIAPWVDPDEEQIPISRPAERSQVLEVPPGAPFQIGFQPRPGTIGRHAYSWTVTAPECNPFSGSLTLDYQTPTLVGPEVPIVVRVGPGTRRDITIPVRLLGVEGEWREVIFRPDRLEKGRAVFDCEAGTTAGEDTIAIALEIPDRQGAVKVAAVGEDDPASESLHLGLTIPEDVSPGRYRTKGLLTSLEGNAKEAMVELEVVVNTLEILVLDDGPDGQWTPRDLIDLGALFFDAELLISLRVRTSLGDVLQPDQVRFRTIGPFQNDSLDLIEQVPRLADDIPIRVLEDGKELELTLRIPRVRNADPLKYYVHTYFDCPDLELETQDVEFVVKFLDTRSQEPRRPR